MKGSIVVLLAVIAASVAYLAFKELQKQNAVDDYKVKIIQSRIADGLRLTGEPRAAVTQFYNDFGKFPASFNEAGFSIGSVRLPDHIKDILLGSDGAITISFRPSSLGMSYKVSEAEFVLRPDPMGNGQLNWNCAASEPFDTYQDLVPAACRY